MITDVFKKLGADKLTQAELLDLANWLATVKTRLPEAGNLPFGSRDVNIGGSLDATGVGANLTIAINSLIGAGGLGNMVGPASSTADHVLFFADALGKVAKDSGLTLSGTNSGDSAANSLYDIGSDVQAYNSNLTAINQALTTTSSPSFTAVGATTFTGALTGHASSDALVDQIVYLGTTGVKINRVTGALSLAGVSIDGSSATVTGAAQAAITSVGALTNITPGANFTLTQNAVAALTSENAGAIVNTLYLKAGKVGVGMTDPGAALHLGSDAGTAASGIQFGSDVTLYRSAADTLKTGDNLEVAGGAIYLGPDITIARQAADVLHIYDAVNIDGSVGIDQAAADGIILSLQSSTDISQPFTDFASAGSYLTFQKLSATLGGCIIRGMTDGDSSALLLDGFIGSTNPTDTKPALYLRGGKSDGGTSGTYLADAETVLTVYNWGSPLMTILGSGLVTLTGQIKIAGGSPGALKVLTCDATGLATWEAQAGGSGMAAHVLATNTGLGAYHTVSGATAGQVLRASAATAANFQALVAADIPTLAPLASPMFTGTVILSSVTAVPANGTLGNSAYMIFDNANQYLDIIATGTGVGTITPTQKFETVGKVYVSGTSSGLMFQERNTANYFEWLGNAGAASLWSSVASGVVMAVNDAGEVGILSLAGAGNRAVYADFTGKLYC